jgi:hypothetical protein
MLKRIFMLPPPTMMSAVQVPADRYIVGSSARIFPHFSPERTHACDERGRERQKRCLAHDDVVLRLKKEARAGIEERVCTENGRGEVHVPAVPRAAGDGLVEVYEQP